MALRALSLCAGIGGLDIAVDIALGGVRPVCYVERELSAARVLAQRMEEGCLPPAPIWSDLATFDGRRLRGMVDVVTAGFPCPDYSYAGQRAGRFGKHGQVWDLVLKAVRDVEPAIIALENVAGIRTPHRKPDGILPAGLWYVLGDLAESGYDAEWLCLRASDVGAPHSRDRWFCLAWRRDLDDADSGRREQHHPPQRAAEIAFQGCVPVADADGEKFSDPGRESKRTAWTGQSGQGVPDSIGEGCEGRESLPPSGGGQGQETHESTAELHRPLGLFPPAPDEFGQWAEVLERFPHLAPAVEPGFCCVADGLPVVVDAARAAQLRALGNAVIPLQAAVAVRELLRRSGLIAGCLRED